MQGRITTVLNMKPEEILGMVEEAAGTKMYDQKKKEAEKTIFLKDAKMKEIDRVSKSVLTCFHLKIFRFLKLISIPVWISSARIAKTWLK